MKIDLTNFGKLRVNLFTAIRECLEVDNYCKSYEGALTIEIHFPSYFQENGELLWNIHLSCYLIGPSRGYDWEGKTFEEALEKAEKDIYQWLKEHDEWLKEYRGLGEKANET